MPKRRRRGGWVPPEKFEEAVDFLRRFALNTIMHDWRAFLLTITQMLDMVEDFLGDAGVNWDRIRGAGSPRGYMRNMIWNQVTDLTKRRIKEYYVAFKKGWRYRRAIRYARALGAEVLIPETDHLGRVCVVVRRSERAIEYLRNLDSIAFIHIIRDLRFIDSTDANPDIDLPAQSSSWRDEACEEVQRALDQFERDEPRGAIILRGKHLENLTFVEIGQNLRISPDMARYYCRRAEEKFRERFPYLAEYLGDIG